MRVIRKYYYRITLFLQRVTLIEHILVCLKTQKNMSR